MKTSKLFAAFVTAAVLTSSFAHARPDTRYMSCSQATALVNARGAIVLSTSAYKYDKYVRNHAYCNLNQKLKRAWVPTSDARRCKIGFICSEQLDLLD